MKTDMSEIILGEIRHFLKSMRATWIAVVLAVLLILAAALINLPKLEFTILNGIEKHEIGVVLIGLCLIFVGFMIDRFISDWRNQREAEVQKLRTLQATMRTVQDIVNNFLNNLLLVQMEMEGIVPRHCLDELDQMVWETHNKLKALGDVESVREKPLAVGSGIEYPELPTSGNDAIGLGGAFQCKLEAGS
jgi:hypothetical protein